MYYYSTWLADDSYTVIFSIQFVLSEMFISYPSLFLACLGFFVAQKRQQGLNQLEGAEMAIRLLDEDTIPEAYNV